MSTNKSGDPVDNDLVSTGAAADSAEWEDRLKCLPRLLRYAVLVVEEAHHIEKRLISEISELCPALPLNAAWANTFDVVSGIELAKELDYRAVTNDKPALRGLADCVRLVSLPTPHDDTYFDEHKRVGKALILAFRKVSSLLEQTLQSNLERFVFAWAALPVATDQINKALSAAQSAKMLAPKMYSHSIYAACAAVWRQVEEHEAQRKKEEKENDNLQVLDSQSATLGSAGATLGHSLVVARMAATEIKSQKMKDIVGPLKDVINAALPLIKVPQLHNVRSTLMYEFPYAAHLIDLVLADLVGHTTIHFRPLLIVGEPGGGKSRFCRRLAEAIGVSIWRTDASQCDGAVFAGTAKRWNSAEPCHPFLAIARGKIANPLILIDEIEKAASRSDYGRLWDALLGFLEVETSSRYPDPALMTDLDLSQVSYLATANRLDPLPAPLKDRFRILHFPKPTAHDLDSILTAVIADLGKERGLNQLWITPLDGSERMAVQYHWRGGSIRRLRAIVEAILHERDARATRN